MRNPESRGKRVFGVSLVPAVDQAPKSNPIRATSVAVIMASVSEMDDVSEAMGGGGITGDRISVRENGKRWSVSGVWRKPLKTDPVAKTTSGQSMVRGLSWA